MISLNWFKKNKEMESLKVEEQRIKNSLLRSQLEKYVVQPELGHTTYDKLFKMVKFVNNVLTVVMKDGSIISKSDATIQDFRDVKGVQSEEDLFFIMSTDRVKEDRAEFEKELEKNKAVVKGFPILEDTGDFIIEGDTVHLKELYDKGVRRTIPKLLVEKFSEIAGYYEEYGIDYYTLKDDVEYNSLKKFWLKCCLNPNAQSAEDLYRFLEKHNFKIDKHGNFYAYRRVVSIKNSTDKALVDFVSNAYNKVKAVWKKKPADYFVYTDEHDDYKISKSSDTPQEAVVGNLESLYLNLPEMAENRYTAWHGKGEDYRVGKTNSMPRDEGDDNNQISCSRGYHVASQAYDYSGFGDIPILAIVNPMDVLSVPQNEDGKMRTCRWFFAMTLPEDEKFILEDDDFDVTELGDLFEEQCSTDLVNYVHNSIAEEVKRHTFTVPSLSNKDITNIISSLDGMRETLTKRVSIIK